eukprot:3653267-Pleurochrysis_carterae.AAC.6
MGWATGGINQGADPPRRTVRGCTRIRRKCDSLVRGQPRVARFNGAHAAPTVRLLGGYPSNLPLRGLSPACDPRLASQPNRPALSLLVTPRRGGWVRERHPAASLATQRCAIPKSKAPWSRGRLLPTCH